MIRQNLIIGTLLIAVAVVLHVLLIHPMQEGVFRGEEVEVYSISALIFSFLLKCLIVIGLYYYIRAASLQWPRLLGGGTLMYKISWAFLMLLVFLNLCELVLKGIYTQEELRDEVEQYQNPDILESQN